MKHPDLINLSERIQKYADGITVNRDALARDMARVVQELSQRRDLGVPQQNASQPRYDWEKAFWSAPK